MLISNKTELNVCQIFPQASLRRCMLPPSKHAVGDCVTFSECFRMLPKLQMLATGK